MRVSTDIWQKVYAGLAFFGLIATWFYNLQYFSAAISYAFSLYLQSALVNAVTTAITIDVYLCALVFSLFAWRESSRLGIARCWIFIGLAFAVGLAVAWPLFLAVRERHLKQ